MATAWAWTAGGLDNILSAVMGRLYKPGVPRPSPSLVPPPPPPCLSFPSCKLDIETATTSGEAELKQCSGAYAQVEGFCYGCTLIVCRVSHSLSKHPSTAELCLSPTLRETRWGGPREEPAALLSWDGRMHLFPHKHIVLFWNLSLVHQPVSFHINLALQETPKFVLPTG